MSEIYLGIEIGGTKIQLCTGSGAAGKETIHRFEVTEEMNGERLFAKIAEEALKIQEETPFMAVGVGFGGPVSQGIVLRSFQVSGWELFPLQRRFAEVLERPVFVDNDANLAALGEYTQYKHRVDPMFYVTLGSGIGGGFIYEGKIYRGVDGRGIEIGHMKSGINGQSFESCCSGWALDRQIRSHLEANPESSLFPYLRDGETPTVKLLKPALEDEDPEARKMVAEWARHMAFFLSQMHYLLNPRIIVLGGGVSLIGPPLLKAINSELKPLIDLNLVEYPQLELASLGEQVVPWGAIIFAEQKHKEE